MSNAVTWALVIGALLLIISIQRFSASIEMSRRLILILLHERADTGSGLMRRSGKVLRPFMTHNALLALEEEGLVAAMDHPPVKTIGRYIERTFRLTAIGKHLIEKECAVPRV